MSTAEHPSRPNVQMSQEEHGAITKLTATVDVLVGGLNDLKNFVVDQAKTTDARFNALAERGRFSRGDLFGLVSVVVAIAGVITALLSMRIDTALAPIQTQNQVSIVDRAGLHNETAKIETVIAAGKDARLAAEKATAIELAVQRDRVNELYHAKHGHYPSSN